MKRLLIFLTATAMLCSCAHYPWEKKKKKKRYKTRAHTSAVVRKPQAKRNASPAHSAQIAHLKSTIKLSEKEVEMLRVLLEIERRNKELNQINTTSNIDRNIEAQRSILNE